MEGLNDGGLPGGVSGEGGGVQSGVQNGGVPGAGGVPGGNIPNAGGPGQNPAWSFLPDGLQSLAEGYDKPETFWADVNRLKGMAKEREVLTGKVPESFASEDEWDAFWKAAGRPDTAEGYQFGDWHADGVPPELSQLVNQTLGPEKGELAKIFRAANLTAKQAELVFRAYGGLVAEAAQQEAAAQIPDAQIVQSVWPQDTQKHLDAAIRGARHAGVVDALDGKGLSRDPDVLKLAHALGETLGEGGLPGKGGANAVLPTGEEARQEMYRVIESQAYKNNDPAAMKKLEALAARVGMK